MKRSLFLITLFVTLCTTVVLAQSPRTLNYQGHLTTDGVTPVADGNYIIDFNLYDVSGGGTTLWTENHGSIQVTNGDFAVTLGLITPINLPFDVQYWLGIAVDPDPEMAQRVELTASPYAMGLNTTSSIVIGQSAQPSVAGELRYNGSQFEGYNGATWDPLGGGVPNLYSDGTNVGVNIPAPLSQFQIDSMAHLFTTGGDFIISNNLYIDAGTPRYSFTGNQAAWLALGANGRFEYSATSVPGTAGADASADLPGNSLFTLFPSGDGGIAGAFKVGPVQGTPNPGQLQYTGSSFEGYDGSVWKPLGSSFQSPFLDDGNSISIGSIAAPITAPGGDQSLIVSATTGQSTLGVTSYGGNGSALLLMEAGGTDAAPTATQNFSEIGRISFTGYNGTQFLPAANIRGRATEAWTGAAAGTKIELTTVETGTLTTHDFTFDHSGYLGINQATPGAWLHVIADNGSSGLLINQTGGGNLMELQNTSTPVAIVDQNGKGFFSGLELTSGSITYSYNTIATDGALDPGFAVWEITGGATYTINPPSANATVIYAYNSTGGAVTVAGVAVAAGEILKFIYLGASWIRIN